MSLLRGTQFKIRKTIRFVNKEVGEKNIHVVSLSMMNYHLIHKKNF